MQHALIFSIEEFSTFDGPGIRTTVFLKGCPLRCQWCHNPEGQSFYNSIIRSDNGCIHCGECIKAGYAAAGKKELTKESIAVCPNRLIRMCAQSYTTETLADKLGKNLDILNASSGGVTFSGGEPLAQPKFLIEVLELLEGKTNRAIQTSLTKQGLGFPQYCNDDVVIPGLIKLGYAPEDAADYVVAACWEFIVPGKGADVPNIGVMNFPKAVEAALKANLKRAESFEEVVESVKEELIRECDSIVEKNNHFMHIPSPYFSVFFPSCVENGKDISEGGAVYNNYGIHGTGISTAADSLMAVKRAVYDEKRCTAEELLKALGCDYESCNQLRNYLLSCPKMGNNEPEVDDIGSMLMDTFAKHMNHRKNNQGGIYRAGTGSAMEYILSAKTVGATPDGRHAGDVYGSSFSPAVTTKLEGPLSCIRSFTKYEMENIINGGPLTIEIHDTTFRNEQGVQKVAMLVQTFIGLGGHQIQLNAVNRERLLDAQQHPEDHRNLIVRVWGWSGYFNELDKEYQDHIIRRTEFQL